MSGSYEHLPASLRPTSPSAGGRSERDGVQAEPDGVHAAVAAGWARTRTTRPRRTGRARLLLLFAAWSCSGDSAPAGDAGDATQTPGDATPQNDERDALAGEGTTGVAGSRHLGVKIDGVDLVVPLAPSPLSFDRNALPAGQTNGKVVRLQSVGTADLHIARIRLADLPGWSDGAGTPVFAITAAKLLMGGDEPQVVTSVTVVDGQVEDLALAPGSAVELTIAYLHQDAVDARFGTLTVLSDASDLDYRALVIPVQVSRALPAVSMEPPFLDFGSVPPSESRTRPLRVRNSGQAELVVAKFTFDAHPDFTLRSLADPSSPFLFPTAEEVFFEPPFRIAPGESVVFEVGYTAHGFGPADGTLRFWTSALNPWEVVGLSANSGSPCLLVEPNLVAFGPVKVGAPSARPVTIRSCSVADVKVAQIRLALGSSTTFELVADGLPEGVAPSISAPLLLKAGQSAAFEIRYSPLEVKPFLNGLPNYDHATVTVGSNAYEPEVNVPLTGFGSDLVCPTAVGVIAEGQEVLPLTTLHLSSDLSTAASGKEIVKRKWSVVGPGASSAGFVPSPTFPNPIFEITVAGEYTFTLTVWDSEEVESCVAWVGTVLAIPEVALYVELIWKTPSDEDETDTGADAGSDLDLHFALLDYAVGGGFDGDADGTDDPWFNQPFDCFWFTPNPNWGTLNPAANDDPHLLVEDTDGGGPEAVGLMVPQLVTYGIGVHYWSDKGFGDAFAEIRIFSFGQLIFHTDPVKLAPLDFWDVASVHWPATEVTPVMGAGGGPKITAGYQNPNFAE